MSEGISYVLKRTLLEHGAAVAGIADLARFTAPPGGAIVAIVFGLRYSDEAVDALPRDGVWVPMAHALSAQALEPYSRLAGCLQTFFPGSRCCRMDQAQDVLGARIDGLRQKAAAVLAELGWIGRPSLLVSPTKGPRIRLGTLLSDAPPVCNL